MKLFSLKLGKNEAKALGRESKGPTQKAQTGASGEDIAEGYLQERGFKIVDRNYRKPWGELDIVAKQGNILHFVEVKTVTRQDVSQITGNGYEPEENIHQWKRGRLAKVIQTYLMDKKVSAEVEYQVDAISVYLGPTGEVLRIEWLDDILLLS